MLPPKPSAISSGYTALLEQPKVAVARCESKALSSFCLQSLLLLSGFCGISYEILYARMLGNLVGDQFAVSASILLSFMLGIGIGALYAHHLWRFLWLVEAAIGLCGLAFVLGTPFLESVIYPAGQYGISSLGKSMLWCSILLSLPSFLVGCSVPLFAGYLDRLRSGGVFARAYSLYNFGAAAMVLIVEFWLLRTLGLTNSLLALSLVNFAIAASLWAGFPHLRQTNPTPLATSDFPLNHTVALALAGVASAIYQLLMIKLAECFLGPFRETFALVLCVVLLGIAFGSVLTKKLRLSLGGLLAVNLAGLAWLLGGFELITRLYASYNSALLESHFLSVLFKLSIVCLLMALPALTFGATVPSVLRAGRDVAKESGKLLSIASAGNAFGFLWMALYLHRHFDYGVLLVFVATLSGASWLIYSGLSRYRVVAVVALWLVVFGVHRTLWDENLLYLGYTSFDSTGELKEVRSQMIFPNKFKGGQDVFSVNETRHDSYFFINGFISIQLNSPSEKIVGAFSSLFAPRTDKALVLGVGSGATAGTVTLLFDRMDGVEINPAVLENLHRMAQHNFAIQSRPQAKLRLDDAIRFARLSREQYPLIINTVTTPLYFSSAKLYTRDFLESIRQRLTPDGVYVTWIDTRVGDRGADIILKTLSQSFKECWLGAIKSGYFLLICSQQKIAIQQHRLVSGNATLNHYFYDENGLRPDWLPYGLLSTRAYDLISDATVPVNTLDYPVLEFEITQLGTRGMEGFLKRLRDQMNVVDVAAALPPSLPFQPLDLAVHVDRLLGDSLITTQWNQRLSERIPDFNPNLERARVEFAAAYATAANTADAHHHYGFRLSRQGNHRDAIREFRRSLEINPKRDNAYFNIGFCYEQLGDYPAALENYARELKVDPFDSEVLPRMGRVFCKAKRFREALGCLETALLTTSEPETYLYRGLALEGLGSLSEAKVSLLKGLTLRPDNEQIFTALARVTAGEP